MAVFEALIQLAGKTNDFKTRQRLLMKRLKGFLLKFKKNELKLSAKELKRTDFDKVILLRDFATDLWNEVLVPELKKNNPRPCNSVLQGLLNRFMIQVKETLFLIGHDMGISAISNVRLFIESYAIAKYVLEKGDSEAQRFMDYYHYQYCLATKTELKKDFINKYGERTKSNSFYSIPYGWCSEDKMTGEKLVSNLKSQEHLDNYHLTCNYIHASPYSTYHVATAENPLSPIPSSFLLEVVKKVLFDFLLLILNFYLEEKEKASYLILLSMLVPELMKNNQ